MDRHRVDEDQLPARENIDPGAVADGDAQLDAAPPNVTETEEPAEAIVEGEDDYGSPELEALQQEYSALSDRHLRLAAEFDNYRRRSERERTELWTRAQGDLAHRLLEVLDDLDRVAEHADGAPEAVVAGVQLVERKLRQALQSSGLEVLDPNGEIFDPNTMEAVAMVATDSAAEDDVVSDVFQLGYRFKGVLLRPARVRVKKHGI